MKWPFVRRSKYELLENELNIVKECHDRFLIEINRLNQELASEMNSHRETKEHEQKIFDAHDKLNQQNMGLLFENEKLSKQNNQLILDKNHLKSKIKRLDSLLTKHKLELESAKKHANWFYGNYARFKDMIEKSGYYKKL